MARGYEQVDGLHYDETTKAAPVTNEIDDDGMVDVGGAFLNGRFIHAHSRGISTFTSIGLCPLSSSNIVGIETGGVCILA